MVLFALLSARAARIKVESQPLTIALVAAPADASPALAEASAQPPSTKPPPPVAARPTPRRAEVEPSPIPTTRIAQASPELSEGELAGAATADSAGSGGGSGAGSGGACNMAQRLQAALRKDRLVQAAARAPGAVGKALMVWNGDWVANPGEDGKGLAAIREAILWEVGFAPAACRSQPVHGLVLLSLNDGPGSTRLAVGADAWRWSDLLALRSAAPLR